MSRLVLAGYLLAALPMVVAVVLASLAIERLTDHSESLLRDGVVATRLSVRLRDELIDVERNARQFQVLAKPELGEVVAQRLQRATDTLGELSQAGLEGELEAAILKQQQALQGHRSEWKATAEKQALVAGLIQSLDALVDQAQAMIVMSDAAIDRENQSLQDAGVRARWIVWIALGALLPLTLLLASALASLVLRPLRDAERGIDHLGHGRYDQVIAISSPEEMRLLGEQLDWLRRRLAQLESDKDRFLSHVTHELKTPLSSLREGVSLLEDHSLGALNSSQQEVVEILDASARELEAMVTKLLSYAEWRREKKHAKPEWFSLDAALREIGSGRKLLLDSRELKIRLDLQADEVWGQRPRLVEVMDNLIGNAIKHAPRGSVIEVRASCADGHCQVQVRDMGRGVPEQLGARIFEPFVRGDVAAESGVRGTGIGLSIVRETLMEHGGTVEVEDAQPGARFILRWPVPDRAERLCESAPEALDAGRHSVPADRT